MASTVLVLQHQDDAPPGQVTGALAAHGLAADVRRPYRGDVVPAALDGLAGLVVLGGSMGALDDGRAPWLPAVRDLLAVAAEGAVPVLGLCLGAQLAAVALGGEVARRDDGYEIAWAPVRRTDAGAADPVLGVADDHTRLLLWHQDRFAPPPGAEILDEDGKTFRRGAVWGLQHHPEADPSVVTAWCEDPAAPAELAQAGMTREAMEAPAARLAAGGRAVLDAWCAEVVRRRGDGR
jgi:GMP synthase (glutamine-hydrolysing)